MSDLVCLNCGKEMEYDWAPCQNCGWKPPEPWESTSEENEETTLRKSTFGKKNLRVQMTLWLILVVSVVWIIYVIAQILLHPN